MPTATGTAAATLGGARHRARRGELSGTIAAIAGRAVQRLIYRSAGNRHLEDVLIRYDNLPTRIWCLALDKAPSVSGHITEHVQILDAIVAGHVDRARRLALEHVIRFEATIRRVLT
jgi:DNA-binding GntR family transcriptional regulator